MYWIIKKHYFIHFLCFLLKSLKAFSVFLRWIKNIFINFKGFSLQQMKTTFLGGESPTLCNLKQRGTFDRQITIDSNTKEPLTAIINRAALLCFNFSLLYVVFFFSSKALKKSPSLSRLIIFCGSYSWHHSGIRLFQACMVVVATSLTFPHNFFF